MKYAIEMGSCAMIYIPSFVKIGSGIHKFMEGGKYRDSMVISKPTFIFQNKESMLIYIILIIIIITIINVWYKFGTVVL
jgi:hypothetical protein